MEPGENSPCSVAWWWKREKILPARLKWPDFGVFGRAGRVLYRSGQGAAVAGRVLYRLGQGAAVAGRVFYRVSGGLVLEAGENSPCSVSWWLNREKVLPARLKWPDFGVFGRAGRVLYRLGLEVGVAGRVLYRVSGGLVLEAGENSPCSREMAGFRCFWACWESFVPVGPGGGCCRESFVPVGPVRGARWGAGLLCGAPLARKLADDGLLFGHADDAGALAQGQGCGHGHGAGAAREHEDNQHVFGAHGQDRGDAGGQADGREC